MPIKVTDYEWNQNELSASIKIGLKNSSPKNVDIIYTSNYLKVNFSPYIFEVFLKHDILPKESAVVFKEGSAHFHLTKAINEEWDSLEIVPLSKEASHILRLKALKEYEDFQNDLLKKRKEVKSSLERLTISKQISWNEEKHAEQKELIRLEELRFFKEKTESESPLKEDRNRLSSLCSEDGSIVASEGDYDGDVESVNYSSCENLHCLSEIKRVQDKSKKAIYPSVRVNNRIKMRHTPHPPSIPKRESFSSSYDEEVNDISKKKSILKIDLQDKDELKAEATKCFEHGDFNGAVKTYSILIENSSPQASYYSNRAAALVALDSYKEAVKDCTKALQLLNPPTKENEKSRLLCYVRRGTSNVRLRNLSLALIDFEAAFRLDPNNIDLAKDTAAIKESLKACPESGEDSSNDSQLTSDEESECGSSQEIENKTGDFVEESQSDFSSS